MTLTDEIAASEPVGEAEATIPHQPALDGLRGLAVAGVLLFHGGHLTGGYLGVDAFFVLSGFLITTLLLVEYGNHGGISLGHFWARRARRLLPALACVLAAVVIYAAFVAQPGELPTIRGDAISTMFYFANWHAIASGSDYFAIFRAPSPLQHTWSLAIEEQFYLVWPLALVAILGRRLNPKAAAKRVLALSLGLAAGSVVLAQLLYKEADPSRVYYGTDTRAAAILLGAALAAGLVTWGSIRGARDRRALEGAAIAASAFLALAWTHLSGSSQLLYRGGLLVCGIAVTVVIASAVHPTRGPVSRVLSFKPLCALGIISYGVYLWHWPVFVWLNEDRAGIGGWPLFALQCAATLAIALVSYRLVERPIRRGWGRGRWMMIGVPVTAVALVITLFAATSTAALPVIDAWFPGQTVVPAVTDAHFQRAMAHLRQRAAAEGNDTRVLVFGDSIALTLATKVAGREFRGTGIDGTSLGLLGCSVLPENRIVGSTTYEQDPKCDNWPELLTDAVDAYRPAIVATMLGPWEMFDRETPNGREDARSNQLTDELEAQLARIDNIATKVGARLVILNTPCYDPPKIAGDAQAKVWRDDTRVAWLNRVWRQFARHSKNTSVADLAALLCPGGQPIERRFGNQYRSDGLHFNASGAQLVWHWIDAEIVRRPRR